MKKILLACFLLFLSFNVNAEVCSYTEKANYSKLASNVKVTYEEYEEDVDPDSYTPGDSSGDVIPKALYFKIKILNVTDDLYVKLENSVNKETKYITYKDTDEGTYTLDWIDLDNVATLTYTIYASEKTICSGEKLKTGTLTLPRYNQYHDMLVCEDIKDFYLCEKYVAIPDENGYFSKKIEEYKKTLGKDDNGDTKPDKEKEKKNYKKVAIIGISILVVAGGATIYLVENKRRSEKNVKSKKRNNR